MRTLIRGAVDSARDLVSGLVTDMSQEAELTDAEVLAQYAQVRGDPQAKLAFVQLQTGLEGDELLDEGVRYEREMERLWARSGGVQRVQSGGE